MTAKVCLVPIVALLLSSNSLANWKVQMGNIQIPTQNYAVIDLSGAVPDGADVTDVALDDTGNIAFGFYTTDDSGNSIYKAYRWMGGTATWETTLPLGFQFPVISDPQINWSYFYPELLPDGKVGCCCTGADPADGLPNGFGLACIVDGDAEGEPPEGGVGVPAPLGEDALGCGYGPMSTIVSDTCYAFWSYYTYTPTGTSTTGTCYSSFITFGNSSYAFDAPPGGLSLANGTAYEDYFEPVRINASGCGWGWYDVSGDIGGTDATIAFWDGQNFDTLLLNSGDTPVDLNDQNQVVIQSTASIGGGYLWENDGDTITPVSSTLSPMLLGQINQVEPLSISNQIAPLPASPADVGFSIVTSAVNSGSNANLLFSRNNDGNWSAENIAVPNGFTITDWTTINKNGVITALGIPPLASGTHALLLVPVEPTAPTIYMFSGHDSDTVNLTTVNSPGWTYQWNLKTSGGSNCQGKFENYGSSSWSTTGTTATVTFRPGVDGTGNIAGDTRQQSPGKNTIQLWINGTLAWEKPIEVIQILPRSSWGALAANTSIMSGMSGINELTVHHSSREAFGTAEILRIQKEHMGLLNGGWFNLHPHPTWGDIGYHFILDPSNDSDPDTVLLYEGRQLEGLGLSGGKYTIPSAVLNKNTLSGIDICILGNYETGSFASWMKGDETFSETRRKKLEMVLTALSFRYQTPATLTATFPAPPVTSPPISYHQQLAAQAPVSETTECPGNTVISTIPTTKTNVQNDLK